MTLNKRGSGALVPTGKHHPQLAVSYDIVKDVVHSKGANGDTVEAPIAKVRCLESKNGADIPQGDFDLVDGSEMIRLKHVPDDPRWIVTSSVP